VSEFLVSPEWLRTRLREPQLRIVDGSWYLPGQGRNAKAEFVAGHIPGAVFFDIDSIADRSSGLPHMLPDEMAFAEAACALGLSETDMIVVYDGAGLFSAPRVWWTLRTFGAHDVRVLDGGLPAWKRAGYEVESGEAKPQPAIFRARRSRDAVAELASVCQALESPGTVVDARAAARFRGEAPEPRPGLPSGHMPGARNLPFDRLIDTNGRLVAPERIRAAFHEAGVDLARPVVTTCGSGVTAATLLFALATLGKRDVSLYDGSWAEWASRSDAKIATGDA
jgi:thiosulfate/3-mercaptopyruvate sulfurtransferase